MSLDHHHSSGHQHQQLFHESTDLVDSRAEHVVWTSPYCCKTTRSSAIAQKLQICCTSWILSTAQLYKHEALLLQRDRATCLSVEILQLRNVPFEKDCNRQITLKYTPKVIAIAAFRYHFLLVACCYNVSIYHRSRDTTTFEVNVTVCDLENSFTFDNKA